MTQPLSAQLDKLLELAQREGVNRFPPTWADDKWYERVDRETAEYHAATKAFRAAIEDTCARAVRAERDTERLDWLASRGCVELTLNKRGCFPEYATVDQGEQILGEGPTLREAIDRAISRPATP